MISSKAHLLETYLCVASGSVLTGSRASSMSSSADGQMRFLGDGEALCVSDSNLPVSKSMDSLLPSNASQIEQNRVLNFRNRLLWEENRKLNEEIKRLKSQPQGESSASSQTTSPVREQNWDELYPVLSALLHAQSKRQGSVADAISMLGQATKDHVLLFAPHGIRHMAVQLLLWTFHLESDDVNYQSQPVRLNFRRQGASAELYTRALEWVGHMNIKGLEFQKSAQELVDTHLSTEQAVEKPSEYNSAILQQIMMRYPEVKDSCQFSSDIVEKQCKPLGQLTTCII